MARTYKWVHGPTTYLGLMVAGFPNLFLITVPGRPLVKTNMVLSIEQHVDRIADCRAAMCADGYGVIEPGVKAEAGRVAHVSDVATPTLFVKADSWYPGATVPGKPRIFMPYVGGIGYYRRGMDTPPALVYATEFDVLGDESEAYAEQLARAGVPMTLRRLDALPYGFIRLQNLVDEVDQALTNIAADIAGVATPASVQSPVAHTASKLKSNL
jgi:hypothetical protein